MACAFEKTVASSDPRGGCVLRIGDEAVFDLVDFHFLVMTYADGSDMEMDGLDSRQRMGMTRKARGGEEKREMLTRCPVGRVYLTSDSW